MLRHIYMIIDAMAGLAPAHRVRVNGFWMDPTTVTNADFRRFVDATGHVTVAERPANAADYPGAPPEILVPSSVVFRQAPGPVVRGRGDRASRRIRRQAGALWR